MPKTIMVTTDGGGLHWHTHKCAGQARARLSLGGNAPVYELYLDTNGTLELRELPPYGQGGEDRVLYRTWPIGTRRTCVVCGQDIEWAGTDWRDRGNGMACLPYANRDGEIVHPAEIHRPT